MRTPGRRKRLRYAPITFGSRKDGLRVVRSNTGARLKCKFAEEIRRRLEPEQSMKKPPPDLRLSRSRPRAQIQQTRNPSSREHPRPREKSHRNFETSLKISAAAAIALQELERLRSATDSPGDEAFDFALERIAQEKLRPFGCDLIVRRRDGLTRLLIRAQPNGQPCDLITHFFHHEAAASMGGVISGKPKNRTYD